MKMIILIIVVVIYLSIYRAVIPLKWVSKTRHTRVRGDITLPFLSVFCLFVGQYTEQRLPRPLALLLLSPLQTTGIRGRILVAITTGLMNTNISQKESIFRVVFRCTRPIIQVIQLFAKWQECTVGVRVWWPLLLARIGSQRCTIITHDVCLLSDLYKHIHYTHVHIHIYIYMHLYIHTYMRWLIDDFRITRSQIPIKRERARENKKTTYKVKCQSSVLWRCNLRPYNFLPCQRTFTWGNLQLVLLLGIVGSILRVIWAVHLHSCIHQPLSKGLCIQMQCATILILMNNGWHFLEAACGVEWDYFCLECALVIFFKVLWQPSY